MWITLQVRNKPTVQPTVPLGPYGWAIGPSRCYYQMTKPAPSLSLLPKSVRYNVRNETKLIFLFLFYKKKKRAQLFKIAPRDMKSTSAVHWATPSAKVMVHGLWWLDCTHVHTCLYAHTHTTETLSHMRTDNHACRGVLLAVSWHWDPYNLDLSRDASVFLG